MKTYTGYTMAQSSDRSPQHSLTCNGCNPCGHAYRHQVKNYRCAQHLRAPVNAGTLKTREFDTSKYSTPASFSVSRCGCGICLEVSTNKTLTSAESARSYSLGRASFFTFTSRSVKSLLTTFHHWLVHRCLVDRSSRLVSTWIAFPQHQVFNRADADATPYETSSP